MNFESIREYCLSKAGATEEFPFDEHTLVFKVKGKMFALIPLQRQPSQMNLKCDPERAIELRENFNSVKPGFHMNKKHWNTVELEGDVNAKKLAMMITHSYELIVSKLTKKLQKELEDES